MEIEVKIVEEGISYTLSEMSINGKYACVGVEDAYNEKKIHGETRIPRGIYKVGKRFSPKFSKYFMMCPHTFEIVGIGDYNPLIHKGYVQHELLWIMDIPGYQYVLIHWGNTAKDTEGCYIVGTRFSTFSAIKGVSASKQAYMTIYPKIMRALHSGEDVTINFKEFEQKVIA